MGKTKRLKEKDYEGVSEQDIKALKRSGTLERRLKMPPFTKKERI